MCVITDEFVKDVKTSFITNTQQKRWDMVFPETTFLESICSIWYHNCLSSCEHVNRFGFLVDDCPHFTFSRGNDLLEPRVRGNPVQSKKEQRGTR